MVLITWTRANQINCQTQQQQIELHHTSPHIPNAFNQMCFNVFLLRAMCQYRNILELMVLRSSRTPYWILWESMNVTRNHARSSHCIFQAKTRLSADRKVIFGSCPFSSFISISLSLSLFLFFLSRSVPDGQFHLIHCSFGFVLWAFVLCLYVQARVGVGLFGMPFP